MLTSDSLLNTTRLAHGSPLRCMRRSTMFQKPISIALVVVALLVLLAAGCTAGPAPAASAPPPPQVNSAVTAKAAAVPIRYADLAFSNGGTLVQVQVKEGIAVKAG